MFLYEWQVWRVQENVHMAVNVLISEHIVIVFLTTLNASE